MLEKAYITSVIEYLTVIRDHTEKHWIPSNIRTLKYKKRKIPEDLKTQSKLSRACFRGQSKDWPILPKVYQHKYDEKKLLLDVMRRASLMTGVPGWNYYVNKLEHMIYKEKTSNNHFKPIKRSIMVCREA